MRFRVRAELERGGRLGVGIESLCHQDWSSCVFRHRSRRTVGVLGEAEAEAHQNTEALELDQPSSSQTFLASFPGPFGLTSSRPPCRDLKIHDRAASWSLPMYALSIYRSIYLSIYLSMCTYLCLSIYLSIDLSIYRCAGARAGVAGVVGVAVVVAVGIGAGIGVGVGVGFEGGVVLVLFVVAASVVVVVVVVVVVGVVAVVGLLIFVVLAGVVDVVGNLLLK